MGEYEDGQREVLRRLSDDARDHEQRLRAVERVVTENTTRLRTLESTTDRALELITDLHDDLDDRRERELRALKERKEKAKQDRKQDHRMWVGIAASFFIAIIVAIIGLAQVGLFH